MTTPKMTVSDPYVAQILSRGPIFVHLPFPKSKALLHVSGNPTVSEVRLMIQALELFVDVAQPDPTPEVPAWIPEEWTP